MNVRQWLLGVLSAHLKNVVIFGHMPESSFDGLCGDILRKYEYDTMKLITSYQLNVGSFIEKNPNYDEDDETLMKGIWNFIENDYSGTIDGDIYGPTKMSRNETLINHAIFINAYEYWAMFYMEVFFMINYLLDHRKQMLTLKYGFKWNKQTESYTLMVDNVQAHPQYFQMLAEYNQLFMTTLIFMNDPSDPVSNNVTEPNQYELLAGTFRVASERLCEEGSFLGECSLNDTSERYSLFGIPSAISRELSSKKKHKSGKGAGFVNHWIHMRDRVVTARQLLSYALWFSKLYVTMQKQTGWETPVLKHLQFAKVAFIWAENTKEDKAKYLPPGDGKLTHQRGLSEFFEQFLLDLMAKKQKAAYGDFHVIDNKMYTFNKKVATMSAMYTRKVILFDFQNRGRFQSLQSNVVDLPFLMLRECVLNNYDVDLFQILPFQSVFIKEHRVKESNEETAIEKHLAMEEHVEEIKRKQEAMKQIEYAMRIGSAKIIQRRFRLFLDKKHKSVAVIQDWFRSRTLAWKITATAAALKQVAAIHAEAARRIVIWSRKVILRKAMDAFRRGIREAIERERNEKIHQIRMKRSIRTIQRFTRQCLQIRHQNIRYAYMQDMVLRLHHVLFFDFHLGRDIFGIAHFPLIIDNPLIREGLSMAPAPVFDGFGLIVEAAQQSPHIEIFPTGLRPRYHHI